MPRLRPNTLPSFRAQNGYHSTLLTISLMTSIDASSKVWVFKIGPNQIYPDVRAKSYVYNNRHSMKVQAGDHFLYLEKYGRYGFLFSAFGRIESLTERSPTPEESKDRPRLHTVFTANLKDVLTFEKPVDISPTEEGQANRQQIGFSRNINDDGLSRSVCRIRASQAEKILALAGVGAESF